MFSVQLITRENVFKGKQNNADENYTFTAAKLAKLNEKQS